MKLPELKKHFQNKYAIRIIAGVLTVAMVGGGAAVYSGRGADVAKADVSTETKNSDDDEEISLDSIVSHSSSDVDKEETVYLISDPSGKVTETIVTEHLFNSDGAATLKDQSDLSDIENTKGKETFEQNGEELTWQANGSDIYYRGSKSGEAPVSQKVTYYLDDQEISPEQLAGKSGKVRIHFDYENNSSYETEFDGKKVKVNVPFVAVTALVLDENFSNIEVSNGKVKTNGDTNIVIGTSMPGLKDSLDVEDSDFVGDIDLADEFEITADVKDFSLTTAMTVVMNATEFTDTDGFDMSDLDDKIEELSDASGKLEDGSRELADGLDKLDSSLGTFADGMKTLSDGLKSYTDGAAKIDNGIGKVKDGVDTLDGSKKTLSAGVSQLKDGSASAASGAKKLVAGYKGDGDENPGLVAGMKSLYDGTKTLSSGVDELSTGISGKEGLLAGSRTLSEGAATVDANMKKISEGLVTLDAGVDKVAATMAAMPKTMEASVQGLLDAQLNSNAGFTAILKQLGEEKVTTENLDAVTAKVVSAKATIIAAMGGNAEAEQTYGKILAGLYQAQGAMSVVKQTSASLASEENQASLKALTEGSETLKASAKKLQEEGTAVVSAGSSQLYAGVQKLEAGVKKLDTGADSLEAGAGTLYSGVQKLSDGTSQLSAGLTKLDKGVGSLDEKVPQLVAGIGKLKKGVDQLSEGSSELVGNNEKLLNGMGDLLKGTNDIVDGVDKLDDGSNELADGMNKFNEEAIEKLVNSYNGDIKSFVNRLQAVLDAGHDYQTFSKVADGQTGSVKFIYKLDAIEEED